MENPRPDKVAVVDEVRRKFDDADATLLTEYRGLDVGALGTLRRQLREAGGDYKIYKNRLVRFAARDLGLEIDALLTGPTAIAFVNARVDGTPGDPVLVAKVLRDFARTNPELVVKGGLLGGNVLGADQARALADVASREELLARFAGGLAAPLQRFAGLLQALPRNLAYGLAALVDKGGAGTTAAAPESVTAEPDATENPDTAAAAPESATAEPDATENPDTTGD